MGLGFKGPGMFSPNNGKKMETTIILGYSLSIGVMENKMETTI